MKLLLNDKEIAAFLVSQLDVLESCKKIEYQEIEITNVKVWIEHETSRITYNIEDMREAFKKKIGKAVRKDLNRWIADVKRHIEKVKNDYKILIDKHTDYFIESIGEELILKKYKESNVDNFIKSTGLQIDKNATLIRRKDFSNDQDDCLFRNMQGNERLLLTKMNNNWPFWFIDTGYTNFLNGKRKIWHRLTRNHLHHFKYFEAPVDRLNVFEFFPQPWRNSGEKILIIEPGEFSARTFNVNVTQWKIDIEKEIRQYTDRPIVFREKYNKKIRTDLYRHLRDEDYYCVININSNAAVESIWAGIPVITLATHISNAVTANSISQINNLPRPHLANWLCLLSYSQFTYEELVNGTASSIIKKYYG